MWSRLKSLHKKELISRQVGENLPCWDAISLSLLEIAATTADKNGKIENSQHFSLLLSSYKNLQLKVEVSSF